jgi:hypothetical protein
VVKKVTTEGASVVATKFFAAPVLFLSAFGVLFVTLDPVAFKVVAGSMLAYFFPPLGKETVIPAEITFGIDPFIAAIAIAYVDIMVALFLLWNYDFAKLIPLLGVWMDKFEKKSIEKTKNKFWMKGLSFVGITLLVIVPFQGTGGVAASIVGRLIGLGKYIVFIAITIGAITGCLIIAYIADAIRTALIQSFTLTLAILISVAIVVVLFFWIKKIMHTPKAA